jgi:hypothetical protein
MAAIRRTTSASQCTVLISLDSGGSAMDSTVQIRAEERDPITNTLVSYMMLSIRI